MVPPRREFLLQTQRVQTHRHERLQDRQELFRDDLRSIGHHQLKMIINRPQTKPRNMSPVGATNFLPPDAPVSIS